MAKLGSKHDWLEYQAFGKSLVHITLWLLKYGLELSLANIHTKYTWMKILIVWLALECRVWSRMVFYSIFENFKLILRPSIEFG